MEIVGFLGLNEFLVSTTTLSLGTFYISQMNFTQFFVFLAAPIILSGCTLIFPVFGDTSSDYTHSEYMARFKTKNDVLSTFGSPNSKEVSDGFEYWTYDKGTVHTSYAGASGNAYYNNSGAVANANGYGTSSSYNKSVRFTFQGNRVTHWSTTGMNYENDNSLDFLMTTGFLVDCLVGLLIAYMAGYI